MKASLTSLNALYRPIYSSVKKYYSSVYVLAKENFETKKSPLEHEASHEACFLHVGSHEQGAETGIQETVRQ